MIALRQCKSERACHRTHLLVLEKHPIIGTRPLCTQIIVNSERTKYNKLPMRSARTLQQDTDLPSTFLIHTPIPKTEGLKLDENSSFQPQTSLRPVYICTPNPLLAAFFGCFRVQADRTRFSNH